jgi:hypothetical protein
LNVKLVGASRNQKVKEINVVVAHVKYLLAFRSLHH